MSRAYSYIRFSRPEQMTGDSIRRQSKRAEEYCTRHGLTLDTSLSLRDFGVSAYRGANATTGALAAFLEAVESGNIPKGSTLVVESLDRLSRQSIRKATKLLESILEAGITVVTLNPERRYTVESLDELTGVIELVLYSSRAHEESEMKSARMRAAWENKKRNAKTKPLTARCPWWLELKADRSGFKVKGDKVKLVERAYQMAIDGHGLTDIVKAFNWEGIKPPRGRIWERSTMHRLLTSRSVLGEYQPSTYRPEGGRDYHEPIQGYYPAVIDEDTFYKAQARMQARKHTSGKGSRIPSNLFTGLVVAKNSGNMTIRAKYYKTSDDRKVVNRQLVNNDASKGVHGAKLLAISYDVFERAILRWLETHVRPEIILSTHSGKSNELEAAHSKMASIKSKIETIKSSMLGDGDVRALIDVLRTLDVQLKEATTRVERLKHEQSNADATAPQVEDNLWLIKRLDAATGDERDKLRKRIKATLPSIIKRIEVISTQDKGQGRTVKLDVVYPSGVRHELQIKYYWRAGGIVIGERHLDDDWHLKIGKDKI